MTDRQTRMITSGMFAAAGAVALFAAPHAIDVGLWLVIFAAVVFAYDVYNSIRDERKGS